MSNKPLIIKTKDIERFFNVSRSTAFRYMAILKDVYKKNENQKVTVKEFCSYYDLPYADVINQL